MIKWPVKQKLYMPKLVPKLKTNKLLLGDVKANSNILKR